MSEKKYNGYANYETWCVHLWLTNDEVSNMYWHDAAQEHAKDAPNSKFVLDGTWTTELAGTVALAQQLKDALEECNPLQEPTVYSDLLNAALSEVDWHEIAECFLEEFRPAPEVRLTRPSPSDAPRFELGKTVSTPAVVGVVTHEEIVAALGRHVRGDWGLVGPEDWQENELSLKEGFRLMSVYETADKTRFWIITEADRSVTTVLLPADY
jgi:hypothetical protein